MIKRTLLVLLLSVTVFKCSSAAVANNPETDKKTEATITGKVIDADGRGIPGINVSCYYHIKKDFLMPLPLIKHKDASPVDDIKTDSLGSYKFTVHVIEKPCEVHVGGVRSTVAESEQFTLKPDETIQIEPLIVRPADKSCKGRVTFEDGQPAANFPYGCHSESFSCIDPHNPQKTNDKGEFYIDHLLPDELFSFWIFPKENTMCAWKKLDPNSKEHQFIAKTADFIELPSDWRQFSTDKAIAIQTTYTKDSKIQFTLPDLQGRMVSLEDEQFKNKAVLVNIYGSWCGGCQLEIPYLVDFKDKYGEKGLEVIGIAFEFGSKEEQVEAIKKTSQKYNVNHPLLIGGIKETGNINVEASIKGLKNFKGYPTTIYIDRSGNVKYIQVGFWINSEPHKKWQLKQMENHIESILSKPII